MSLFIRWLMLVCVSGLAACHTIRPQEVEPMEPVVETRQIEAVPKPLSGTIAQLRLRASESELVLLARLEAELRLLSNVIDEAERAGKPNGQFSYATLRAELDQLRSNIRVYRISEWQQPREIEAMALESHQ